MINRTIRLLRQEGFTLIEIMVTVAILSFGLVAIYQTLFVSMDAYGYYTNYFDTQDWLSEKIYYLQEQLTDSGTLEAGVMSGQIERNHKKIDWHINISVLDADQGLYKVNISLSWREGGKNVGTSRDAYLMSPKLKEFNDGNAA